MGKVSIIITTFNRASILGKTLESALSQTYGNIEVILVDDHSVDNTEEYVRKEFGDQRLRYFKLDKNSGATAARNFGLEKMSGDFFLVWDSDDVLYPEAVARVMSVFAQFPGLAVVSAPARCLLEGREVPFRRMPVGIISKDEVVSRSLATNHKVKVANSALCRDVRYKSKNIDFLINVAMVERGDWYCLDEYLGDVILESDQNSLTIGRRKTDLRLAAERAPYLAEYLTKYGAMLMKEYPGKYAGFSYGAALGFLSSGNEERARRFAIESFRYHKSASNLFILVLSYIPFGREIFGLAVRAKNYLITSNSKTKNFALMKR